MTKKNTSTIINTKNDPFVGITKYLATQLEAVDKIIIDNAKGKSEMIADITSHIISSGGKRIRPILTILSSKLCCNNFDSKYCNLAAAIELIHTATLLHDDVVDNSNLRRGQETANAMWGNKASILVGDYLLSSAFQLMVKFGSLEILQILSKTSGIMADGEVLQLAHSNDIELSEEKYLTIIGAKTAALFSAATKVGAIATSTSITQQNNLADFGYNLGMAFQVMDDIFDYSAEQKLLGKAIGDDFFESKVTLPIIITYQNASNSDKKRLKEIFINNLISQEKNLTAFQETIELIQYYDGLIISQNKAQNYCNAAIDNLSSFIDSQEKEMLLSILNYTITRKN